MEIQVDISRLEELAKIVEEKVMINVKEDVATELNTTLQQKSPFKTGKLSRGWNFKKVGAEIVVENNVDYIGMVINGTRPHEIRPKNKKVLAFKINGQMIFAKYVKHPGTKPNDFVDKSIAVIDNDIERFVNKALKESGVIE